MTRNYSCTDCCTNCGTICTNLNYHKLCNMIWDWSFHFKKPIVASNAYIKCICFLICLQMKREFGMFLPEFGLRSLYCATTATPGRRHTTIFRDTATSVSRVCLDSSHSILFALIQLYSHHSLIPACVVQSEDKKGTLQDVANQKGVVCRAQGWKIHLCAAQLMQLVRLSL